jgi:N4-(beta-N-acetylglucosaminyl)-L-asparaginase
VEAGCAACEANQCDGTVGFGGSPDERCETTLDAMIMDGGTMKSGAVAALRRVKDAISVARRVLEYTTHTLLAGDQGQHSEHTQTWAREAVEAKHMRRVRRWNADTCGAASCCMCAATLFALENGFKAENLTTEGSLASCQVTVTLRQIQRVAVHDIVSLCLCRAAVSSVTHASCLPLSFRLLALLTLQNWRDSQDCQPNYRINVSPDPRTSCGPYTPLPINYTTFPSTLLSTPSASMIIHDSIQSSLYSHDTISLIALTTSGTMAAGTSTNGAGHKVPGRVGDGPITGSGSYVDSDVGGCGATGDGDIMMRFLPCYQAVENMRRGMTPTDAATDAVKRMMRKYPSVNSGLVVLNKTGGFGAAASGWTFSYAYRGGNMDSAQQVSVKPVNISQVFEP